MSDQEPVSRSVAWLYVLVRYRREIIRGISDGWHRRKTYYVKCAVEVTYDGVTWHPLSAEYLRSLVNA